MRLTFGRQHFTLSDNDALFIAEAILLQRKELGVVLPEHRSENTALSVWRVAKPSRACSCRAGAADLRGGRYRNDQLTDC